MLKLRTRRLMAVAATVGVGVMGLSAAASATTTSGSQSTGTSLAASSNSQDTGVNVAASKALGSYWTEARIRSARSADVVVASRSTPGASDATKAMKPQGPAVTIAGTTGSAKHVAGPAMAETGWYGNFWSAPATTTGKVFFSTHDGRNWVCSASVVNSEAKDLLITAGHCVYGSLGGQVPGEGWHSNWTFVPDYYYNYRPFGTWYARQLWTKTAYINNQDEGDDIGAVLLWANNGQNITNLLGGQGIAWNYNSTEYVYDFGYPAEYPFNGQSLQYCNGTASWTWWAGAEQLACNMTGGSSGGPWLAGFNGNWGYVNSVNDFGYSWDPGQMFGLYFGNNVGSLYNQVRYL
jgi:V8-like Glu-specific endopeptidase